MNNERQWIGPAVEAAVVTGTPGSMGRSPEPQQSPYEILLGALEAHIGAERNSLEHYRELQESTTDPAIELIMGIILEDEERHHALMHRIAARLSDDLKWAHSSDALPTSRDISSDTAVYESLRSFVASERSGTHLLQSFATNADGLSGGLPSELLEMMALDSQKHEHLLRFLFHRVGTAIAGAKERSA